MGMFWFSMVTLLLMALLLLGSSVWLGGRAISGGRLARLIPGIIGAACDRLKWDHEDKAKEAEGVLDGVAITLQAHVDPLNQPRLVASARIALPLDMEVMEAQSGQSLLQIGDHMFDRTYDVSGHVADLLVALPHGVRQAMLGSAFALEISGGNLHVTPHENTPNGLLAAADEAVRLAKIFDTLADDRWEALAARAMDPSEPPRLRVLAAECLANARKAPEALVRRLLHAPDAGSRLVALSQVSPLELELSVALIHNSQTPFWNRVEALEVVSLRLDEVPNEELRMAALEGFAHLVGSVTGRLLATLVDTLLKWDHAPSLSRIENRFRAVDREAQAALLRAAGHHGAAAVPFLMEVLSNHFQRHGDACVELLATHGSVALVEELATHKTEAAKALIARLQAGVTTGGGLALSEDIAAGGLSSANVEAGDLSLEGA